MPLPIPHDDEDHGEFIARCMGDETMVDDFDDPEQRRAVCETQWQENEESMGMTGRRYERIRKLLTNTPWAIMPEYLEVMIEVVAMRADGVTLTAEEIKARIGDQPRLAPPSRGAVAVLPLLGVLSQRMNMFTEISAGTSTERFASAFRAAIADEGVNAIVIDIDSPGGTVMGTPELAAEIFAARGRKQVVAVANGLAASAAFWIGSAASEFVASPSGMVGAIGVIAEHLDVSGFEERAGVKTTLISAGKFKTEGHPFGPLEDEARAAIQADVDHVFEMFVKAVAKGRGINANAVRADFGEGRMVMAEEAKRLGMIDRVETLEAVIARLTGIRPGARTIDPVRALTPAGGNPACGMLAGENLGRLLDEAIEREVTEDRTRQDVIEDMADEAGLSPSTVNQIIRGEINCPPLDRLEAFARVLDLTVDEMVAAAEKDGCDYGDDADGESATAIRRRLAVKRLRLNLPQH